MSGGKGYHLKNYARPVVIGTQATFFSLFGCVTNGEGFHLIWGCVNRKWTSH
jgi:hypothetical protein